MSIDRDKALDKIRKCLALGKSSNEHEAAAALRQAQKMMAAHGLTEEDIGLTEFAYETIVTDYEFGKKKPLIVVAVINVVQHALGVEAVMGAQPKGRHLMHTVRYFGPRARAAMATHAHQVMYRACGRAWQAYLEQNPSMRGVIGARASFYHGWCSSVISKVQALAMSKEEVEMIAKKKQQTYGGELKTAKLGTKTIDGELMGEGARAARDFDLHRPVGTERNRLEKL